MKSNFPIYLAKVNKILLFLFLLILLVQFLFPPYFGMDSLSNGKVHTFLGYHPVWKDIPPEKVYKFMLEKGKIVSDSIPTSENKLTFNYSKYESHINKVRLIANTLLLSVTYLLLVLILTKLKNIRRKVTPE